MNKYLRQSIDLLLYSNVFIAICAVAQGLVTYQLLKIEPEIFVLGILFSSTLAVYNFSILLYKPKNPNGSSSARIRWIFSHHRLMITISIISILSIIPLSLFLSTTAMILLICLALISVAYSIPLFSIQEKKFGLRNIPGLKLFLIASVWSLSCVLLPILEMENKQLISTSLNDTLLLLTKRFLFIAAITVPFDIRDIYQDKLYELKTIPLLFGERWALIISLGMLVSCLSLLVLFTQQFDSNFFGLCLSIILTGWLIYRSKWKKDEYYYLLFLDGTMILQFILLLICNFLIL